MKTVFDVREGSPNNFFILCGEQKFNSWMKGDSIFIKNPDVFNTLFKNIGININLESNSFLSRDYLKLISAKNSLDELMPEFSKDLDENTSLLDIWDIYNSLESQRSPFKYYPFLKNIPLKNKKDFIHNKTLYNKIKKWNEDHIRFFSETFSTYSIFTIRPEYYDEECLLLNIFHIEMSNNSKIYCLSLTSEY